mmetsp:Transcript_95183/g.159834  ORF Transcript_95183/g.159834 Transcript_95183/m.159834 type:complete len:112 (-) Transcript_95183:290-625(-)
MNKVCSKSRTLFVNTNTVTEIPPRDKPNVTLGQQHPLNKDGSAADECIKPKLELQILMCTHVAEVQQGHIQMLTSTVVEGGGCILTKCAIPVEHSPGHRSTWQVGEVWTTE